MKEDVVEVACTDGFLETLTAHIADVVIENSIVQTTCNEVIGLEIQALQRVRVVLGIVFMPRPVATYIERSV